MKILRLSIRNVKGIEAIEIDAQGNHVLLSGANAVGKSSVLDAIVFALTGKGVEEPLKAGARKGHAEVDIGEWRVRREVKKGSKPVLSVFYGDKKGAKKASPATFLKDLVGSGLAFDPLAFDKLNGREQRAALVHAAGLDLVELEQARADKYEERTAVNREVKRLQGVVDTFEAFDLEGVSVEELSAKDLVAKLSSLGAANNARKTLQAELEDIAIRKAQIAERLQDIGDIDEQEILDLEDQVENVEVTNAKVRQKRAMDQATEDLIAADDNSTALTEVIEKLDEEKVEQIAAAEFGIDGLQVDDEGLRVNGIPYADLNTTARLGIGFQIAIAQGGQPRVVLIDEASVLDRAHLEELLKAATALDVQVWVARVSDEEGLKFEILEGEAEAHAD
jgi:recombinational DNA repair ATPase RecF